MSFSSSFPDVTYDSEPILDLFLVCGLGSLGQHCVVALKEFGVRVIAIELSPPRHWGIATLPQLLDALIVGDCRHNEVLKQGDLNSCRGAIIVTSNEQVNIETALAIRQLNPRTRLVVRSTQENLNQLLQEQLGNFIAYESTILPASAFTLAALGTETLGYFCLDGQRLQVIQQESRQDDSWCNLRPLYKFNTRTHRLLTYTAANYRSSPEFYNWNPEATVQVGDALIYIRIADAYENFSSLSTHLSTRSHPWQSLRQILKSWRSKWQEFWRLSREQQVQRVAIVCSFIVLLLLVIGTFLFHWTWADMTWLSAFSTTAILLLGGYADLFGELEEIEKIPPWLQLFSLALTLAGTAFVGVLYALLINALLSSRLQLGKSRPAIPSRNHVVVVGLDQIGQRVAKSLQEVKQPLVGITFERNEEADVLPEIPLVVGSPEEIFSHVNLTTAKSVVIVTNDEILNLEIALMVQKINPQSNLVIRTSGQRLAQHLHQLLPNAQVLDTYGAVAEVFAGAAFGENILYLFRLHNQTVLVTEYTIEAEDTLNNLLLAEVSYGYNVIPLLHQQKSGGATFMPSDDIRLEVGERLVVLATIYGLRRIEQGQMQPKQWQVRVESVLNDYGIFEGGNAIYRISGCPLSMARKLMKHLPATLPVKLYQHQGLRLVRALRKVQVKAHLEYCDQ